MSTDPTVQQIFTLVQQLREAAGDGPRTRKLLDELFRSVHNLKATASANGLNSLAGAAHEFENVLHVLRTAETSFDSSTLPPEIWNSLKQEQKHALQQSLAEGARLFLVSADFDVSDFDREFQNLKDTLNQHGEVISTSPSIDDVGSKTINFKILYAQHSDQASAKLSGIPIEALSTANTPEASKPDQQINTIERAFEKFAAELAKAPQISSGNVWEQAVQAGRVAAAATGKDIEFEVRGEDLLSDRSVCDALVYPLIHLVRNAVDHGIEVRGKVIIEVTTHNAQLIITVTDDGRGIDPSKIDHIFRPGFSTAREVSTISGRGVGLDVVQTTINELGGSITVTSKPGHGSTFKISLPL